MDVIVERCAGLDVGKNEVVACLRTPRASGRGRQAELRVFQTFTSSLEALAEWLADNGVTEVVMEATGPYWKPIWYVLEDRYCRDCDYDDLGGDWFARRTDTDKRRDHFIRQLHDLGYGVTLSNLAA
jgi:hypothetical protein